MDQFDTYLDRLASADPTPGGGSAACVVGALGAALCAMVARITQGNEPLAADADRLRERFGAARRLDEAAYGRVVAASGLPKDTDERKRARTAALQAALAGAAEAPLEAAGLAAEGMGLAERTAALQNRHLVSDVECALHFFRAALAASAANVRINHRFLRDAGTVAAQEERLASIAHVAGSSESRALALVNGDAIR